MKKEKIKRIGALATASLLMGAISYVSLYPTLETEAAENEVTTVLTTQTADEGVIDVLDYAVSITVNDDCTVDVSEKITVEFVSAETQSFYRTIPYAATEIVALEVSCENNSQLQYVLSENSDGVTVECLGGVALGSVWAYEIDYTVALKEGELTQEVAFNILNEGWQNTVDNVVAKITLPDSIVNYDVCNAEGDSAKNVSSSLSEDGKTITVSSNKTEAVAASSNAIMVKIYLPDEETVEDFKAVSEIANEKVWTPVMIVALILGSILAICCIVLI